MYPTDLAKAVHTRLKRTERGSPGIAILRKLLEVLYLATLKTEEGKPLQVRIVWENGANPDPNPPPVLRPPRWTAVSLNKPIQFDVPNLTKLCRAADPWTSWVGVFGTSVSDIQIWGMYDQTVHFNTALIRESDLAWNPPGAFQIAANGVADLTVYYESALMARLARDRIIRRENDIFSTGPVFRALRPAMMQLKSTLISELGPAAYNSEEWDGQLEDWYTGTLCRLLVSIQRHQHGGALLITPRRSSLNVKYGIDYDRLPRFLDGLTDSSVKRSIMEDFIYAKYDVPGAEDMPVRIHTERNYQAFRAGDFEDGITGAVRFISSLANVDGLVLLRPDLTVVGFGVEILTKKDPPNVYVSSNPEPSTRKLTSTSPQYFGMRHRSMMRYCHAYLGTVGFVISQDGDIRAMMRVGKRLVMWEDVKIHNRWSEPRPTPAPVPPGGWPTPSA
jgi:hypothetical protein